MHKETANHEAKKSFLELMGTNLHMWNEEDVRAARSLVVSSYPAGLKPHVSFALECFIEKSLVRRCVVSI